MDQSLAIRHPFLAEQYSQQPAQAPAIALLYETRNRYAGMTIGEHRLIYLDAWPGRQLTCPQTCSLGQIKFISAQDPVSQVPIPKVVHCWKKAGDWL